ncbi:hypothetical protein BDI4_300086 [Burkholderia diffusa]|nr:hypothetical protein BDI4_300086 [Burkholderia diffusa]
MRARHLDCFVMECFYDGPEPRCI